MSTTAVPASPSIFHITHVGNLPGILAQGGLLSDARVGSLATSPTVVGMSNIKQRRLSLPVHGHPGLNVGACVPFYFCARSIMLYMLHMGNQVTYKGGQGPIIHLEADLHSVVAHLSSSNRRWAFSLANAGARATEFRTDLADLGDVNWAAVANNNFTSPTVKEGKQAEFLVEDAFEWSLVSRVGVHSTGVKQQVEQALSAQGLSGPVVEVRCLTSITFPLRRQLHLPSCR